MAYIDKKKQEALTYNPEDCWASTSQPEQWKWTKRNYTILLSQT